jgi:hypothetical protein
MLSEIAAPAPPEIMTREAAEARGLSTYFTGEACDHGHLAPRYVCNRRCVACSALERRHRNGDKAAEQRRRRRAFVREQAKFDVAMRQIGGYRGR